MDDLTLGRSLDQLAHARKEVASKRGLQIAYDVLQSYASSEKQMELARSQRAKKVEVSPVPFRDAMIQEFDRVLIMPPEELKKAVARAKAQKERRSKKEKNNIVRFPASR